MYAYIPMIRAMAQKKQRKSTRATRFYISWKLKVGHSEKPNCSFFAWIHASIAKKSSVQYQINCTNFHHNFFIAFSFLTLHFCILYKEDRACTFNQYEK